MSDRRVGEEVWECSLVAEDLEATGMWPMEE